MRNVPIIGKLLTIMAALAVFMAAGVAFLGAKMLAANDGYTQLIAHQIQAAILVTRANRAFQAERAFIGDLLISTSDQGNVAASAGMAQSKAALLNYLAQAERLDPAHQVLIEGLRSRASKVVDGDCASTISLGLKATAVADVLASQKVFLASCSPAFGPTSVRMTHTVDDLVHDSQAAAAALSDTTRGTLIATCLALIAGLAAVIAAAYFAFNSWLVSPLAGMVAVMGRLAKGDYTAMVEGQDRRDEVGAMAHAVEVFKAAGLEKVRLESETAAQRAATEAERVRTEARQAEIAAAQKAVVETLAAGLSRVSAGDLTDRVQKPFAPEYEKLRADYNSAVGTLQQAMVEITGKTANLRNASGEISQAADDLSRRTEQQAASLEETAAALDEITVTVKKTAERAAQSLATVSSAQGDAEAGGAVVGQAVQAMSEIERSSREVSQIIGVIDEIAFQTNLLALNAGVEAARAGDAGRGFAVVASEVRALAQRSAEAAKEIKGLISASSRQVSDGVDLVGRTGASLKRIVDQMGQINALVAEISASAQEQAIALQQVNVAINQMDQTTQQNAAMVEESTAASHSLTGETGALAQLIGRFDVGQPQAAAPAAPSPRRMMKTTGHGGAAPKPQADASEWEEF